MTNLIVLILASVAISILAVADKSQEELIKISEVNKLCLEQTRASKDTLNKLISGDFTKRDKSTQCFSLCFLTFSGFYDDNANLLIEQSIDLTEGTYGRENVYKWIHKCKEIKGEDSCESAYLFYECFFKEKTAPKSVKDKEL